MKHKRAGLAIGVAFTAAIALTSCAANESNSTSSGSSSGSAAAALSGTISGVGSSAQGTAQLAWIAAFQKANSGVTINYDPSGSGAGRTAFIAGGAQFAGSDSPLKPEELASTFKICKSGTKGIDIPDYISPIAIAFNVSGVKTLNLTPEVLAEIMAGKIKTWNDSAITALNKGETFPSTTIDPVYRSDKSGTTNNVTSYLNATAPSVFTAAAADVWPFTAGDGANGTSGVISAIKSGKGTIGYADESKTSGMTVAKIKVGDTFVAPSADGAAKVVDNSPLDSSGRSANDIAVKINRTTTDPTEYPLTLVSSLVVCQTYADSSIGSLVKAYATYVTSSDGQSAAATAAGSAPLGSALAAKVATAVASIK